MPPQLLGLLGGLGGGGGPKLDQTANAGPSTSGASTGSASGAGISVLSPGAGFNIGSTGIIVLAIAGIIGLVFLMRGK